MPCTDSDQPAGNSKIADDVLLSIHARSSAEPACLKHSASGKQHAENSSFADDAPSLFRDRPSATSKALMHGTNGNQHAEDIAMADDAPSPCHDRPSASSGLLMHCANGDQHADDIAVADEASPQPAAASSPASLPGSRLNRDQAAGPSRQLGEVATSNEHAKNMDVVSQSASGQAFLLPVGAAISELPSASMIADPRIDEHRTGSQGEDSGPRLMGMWIYPIKSCAGCEVDAWPLCPTGLLFDRHWALVDADHRVLTQKRLPALAGLQPTIDLAQGAICHPHSHQQFESSGCAVSEMAEGSCKTAPNAFIGMM